MGQCMGDQLSLYKSCCPIVVDPREIYFVAEQKRLIEKQTNAPYRLHRRRSSLITNHSPIPIFCSTPQNYTFYFATLTRYKPEPHSQPRNAKPLSMLQHGELQFNFGKTQDMRSVMSPSTIRRIAPMYDCQRFSDKMDDISKSILLESVSPLTSINWFYYNGDTDDSRNDSECVLLAASKNGLIHRIDKDFNVTEPIAKICAQDPLSIAQVLPSEALDSNHISESGYNITWSTTKDGSLLFGSNGLRLNTSVVKYNRSQEISSEDWSSKYNLIRYGCGAIYPGFIWIECMLWSHIHEKWFILPRFMSINAPYDDATCGNYGCNVMLRASHSFATIEMIPLDLSKPKHNNEAYVRSLYKNKDLLQHAVDTRIDCDKAKKHGIQTMNDLDDKQKEKVNKIQKDISKSLCYSEEGAFGFVCGQFLSGTNDQIIMGIRKHEKKNGDIESSVCVFNIYGDVLANERILDAKRGYDGLIIL
eukprot:167714_1